MIMCIRLVISVLVSVLLCGLAAGQWTYDCRRMNDCQNGGTCLLGGQGVCQCPTGFTGYNCQEITGANCSTTLICKNGGVCYVDGVVEKCACAFGYYGSTCDNETVMVACDGSTARFDITFPEVFEGTVKLTGDNISDVCAFSNTTADGMITYSLTVSITQDSNTSVCGNDNLVTSIAEKDNDANYTGRIEVRYFDLVLTFVDQLFQLTCNHGEVDFSKDITNIGVDTAGNLTQVEVTQPYSPVEFEIVSTNGSPLPESIYVGDSYKICFYLTDTSSYKKVYIKSCSTNNTLEPPRAKKYEIYNQGCPTKKGMRTTSIQEATNKTIDGVNYPSVCLTISAFKFIDSENLALSCKVQMCRENTTNCGIPTDADCTAIIDGTGTTTVAPETGNTTGSTDNTTNANGSNATTAAPNTGGNDTTTAAPTGGTGNTTNAPADNATTTPPSDGSGTARRRRRAADDEVDTEEKTVTTVLTVKGQRDYTSGQSQGVPDSTVEDCLSQTEIMAVVAVLGSVVLVLFIACFILVCIIMKRKSKIVFEPQTIPNPERFQIPRAYVNQAYREI